MATSVLRIVVVVVAVLLSIFAVISFGCASSKLRRDASPEFTGQTLVMKCQSLYMDTDMKIRKVSTNFGASNDDRNAFLRSMATQIEHVAVEERDCWRTAHENHAQYDLYYAEFDDAGQATDIPLDKVYEQSQLHLIKAAILSALADENGPGLNIVVFTHGWHGNASAHDSYSIEFKGVLLDIAAREDA
jgi:hypothetical protein